jgi:hypothetical protein
MANSAQMQRIVAACKRTGKPFKTMPPIGELIGGRVSLKLVREGHPNIQVIRIRATAVKLLNLVDRKGIEAVV